MPNPIMPSSSPLAAATAAHAGSGAVSSTSAYSAGPGPEIMAADTLEGDSVINTKGELLGTIQDIMIDVPRGRVAYAVISTGGVLGIGSRLHAVPWATLILDANRKCFVLDLEKERLDNAPAFDKDHWPSMADQHWATTVHGYYGAQPYWS